MSSTSAAVQGDLTVKLLRRSLPETKLLGLELSASGVSISRPQGARDASRSSWPTCFSRREDL